MSGQSRCNIPSECEHETNQICAGQLTQLKPGGGRSNLSWHLCLNLEKLSVRRFKTLFRKKLIIGRRELADIPILNLQTPDLEQKSVKSWHIFPFFFVEVLKMKISWSSKLLLGYTNGDKCNTSISELNTHMSNRIEFNISVSNGEDIFWVSCLIILM